LPRTLNDNNRRAPAARNRSPFIHGSETAGAIPSLANKYIFGDLTGKIFSLTEAPANTWTRADLLTTNLTISSLGQDNSGEMYVVDYGGGNVLKLVSQ